jgi:AraC-like DNA-binding protein
MSSLEAARAATLMQEYIETKLREPITLRELADAAGYSPWHAARLFKGATGLSPFDYIRSRRLTKAALLLRDGHERVIERPARQSEPYDDENFEDAIGEIWQHVKKFDPKLYGYDWDPEAAPRFQLEPMGYR